MDSQIINDHKEEKETIYNKRFGIIFNGQNNLEPLVVENLINKSPTATQCSNIYSTFLSGAGFTNKSIDNINLSDGWEKQTPNDLLCEISESLSRHQGVFIHIGYNGNLENSSFKVIPYTLCRLGKKDSDNYSGRIVVSKNGWGKYLKQKDVIVYDSYNPSKKVLQKQIVKAGGIEDYKGQILFFRLDKKYDYPKSLMQSVYLFADLEYRLSLFYNATTKRGFNDITILRHHKFESEEKQANFYENAKKVSGVNNASSLWAIEDDWNDESNKQGKIRFDTLKSEQKPDRYAHFEMSSANFIRKAFKNIPPQLIDFVQGKLGGTTGEDLVKAQSIYNANTARDRKMIQRLFAELFKDKKEITDWSITQYKLIEDGTVA
ncbi:hypothetical protein N9H19_00845 [Flavobacteriales bacterium]|nr:hypothetical protein [Flavobacteriales bacterium]